jgi:hypothetical protein
VETCEILLSRLEVFCRLKVRYADDLSCF